MASSVRPLTDLTLKDLWREVKDPDTLWGDIAQETQRRVKFLLENRMNEEVLHYLRAPATLGCPAGGVTATASTVANSPPPGAPSPTWKSPASATGRLPRPSSSATGAARARSTPSSVASSSAG